MIAPLGGRRRDADKLVEVGLWHQAAGGYQFHEWDVWQPTKEQVTADREATKQRQQAWRDRQRNGVTSTSRNASGDVSRTAPRPDPTRPGVPSEHSLAGASGTATPGGAADFDEFWRIYPKHVDVAAARKAWHRALTKAEPATILDALRTQLPALEQPEPQFRPNPSTWLGNERWLDAPPPPREAKREPGSSFWDNVVGPLGPDEREPA